MPDDGIAAGQRLTLQEYEDNDFIRGLPPIRSTKEAYRTLHAPPIFDVSEREMAMELRRHCVLRLKRYYEPLPMHIDLAAKIEMLVYQGYVGRNPGHGGHARQLLRTPDAVKAGPLPGPAMSAGKTAGGMALVGCSGIGKSNLVEKIHAQYEPVISHSARFRCEQVPFVKLDCPHNGSEAVLCDSFFIYLDNLLGTDFHKRHGGDRRTVGGKLLAMAQLAVRHAVGVIVIDEIQHLVSTRGADVLLKFLVTLENTIGVPIMLVGTLAAYPLFQGTFRQARRVSGFGSVVWDRMPQDDTWRHFARRLWGYQWTREPTPWTPEIDEALYDESQGITDITVKLAMMCQMRAMKIGEKPKGKEAMSAAMIRRVAREDFQLVAPMIDALRRNDRKAMMRYDDLVPFHQHFAAALAASMMNTPGVAGAIGTVPDPRMTPPVPRPVTSSSETLEIIRTTLARLQVADDTLEAVLAGVVARGLADDPLGAMAAAMQLLAEIRAPRAKRLGPKQASSAEELATLPPGDLRALVAAGAAEGRSPHAALLQAGVVARPSLVGASPC